MNGLDMDQSGSHNQGRLSFAVGWIKSIIRRFGATLNFFNGTFLESFDARVTSDGATITMSLEMSGTGNLTMVFSDGHTVLDCTPALTIALTAGTTPSPQENFIYIPQSTKVLTKSTSGFPSNATEHIRVGFFFCASAADTATSAGAIINQNHNDHAQGLSGQGHESMIGQRIRADGAIYFSGVDGNGTTDYVTITAGNVEFITTAGVVFQMHSHAVPAFDTSAGDMMHVKNWSGDANHALTNLFDIVADSTGAAITNNKYFNLVFWGVSNKTGEHQTFFINLPSGFYNTQSDAEADVSGHDDFTMPRQYTIDSTTGFLVARMTFQMGGTWSHASTVDLRGQTPQTASGGAAAAITSFADNAFDVFNNADNTKLMMFDVSAISAATTRTITMPDADINLGDFGVAIFSTINCPLGTDPVADSSADTLNLTSANAHLTITGTAGTDTVDFAVVTGTSGTKIPLLDGLNVWSTDQQLSGATELQLRNSSNRLYSPSASAVILDGSTTISLHIGGAAEATVVANALTFVDGGVTTSLDWSTGGKLGFKVSVTEVMNITASGLDVALLSKALTFESDVPGGVAPIVVASTVVCANLNADQVDGLDSADLLLVDGSQALSANWDAGAFEIRAATFESDIVTGTAPLVVASTTVCANLNVDQVDGADVGTSGAVIGLLDAAVTRSGTLTMGTTTKLQFHDASQYINAPADTILDIVSGTSIRFIIGATQEASLTATTFTVVNAVACESLAVTNLAVCESLRVTGDTGGGSGTVTFTDIAELESGLSGGTATLGDFAAAKETGPATGLQAAWLKLYVGNNVRWIPYWA